MKLAFFSSYVEIRLLNLTANVVKFTKLLLNFNNDHDLDWKYAEGLQWCLFLLLMELMKFPICLSSLKGPRLHSLTIFGTMKKEMVAVNWVMLFEARTKLCCFFLYWTSQEGRERVCLITASKLVRDGASNWVVLLIRTNVNLANRPNRQNQTYIGNLAWWYFGLVETKSQMNLVPSSIGFRWESIKLNKSNFIYVISHFSLHFKQCLYVLTVIVIYNKSL